MVEVPITIACGNYDRTRAIRDGRVKVELALARGKNVRDRRRDLADRDARRQIERALKESSRG